ncbi:MAG: hypothetical protein KN64_07910 [Sulfurovum sp. AS07-7]|nr:MAG: hypothetical protein KN64_07910 [Sulfurovum sp. AS07-7]
MPKVSVLMNCYNGEKYLREAIDSIVAQTFSDWEIVFIDNCSSDNSAQIAQSYGEKLKYYRTNMNIPLGAAREWGMQFCKGDYIAFLDTDDVWLPLMLEKQIEAIESNDYTLAYAGQIEIDAYGNIVGEMIPSFKKGNIFRELLLQYDIPIVSAMVNRQKLEDSRLNFDPSIFGSEEYCLFMQLAVDAKFIVIPEALVKYRVYKGSLTSKTMSKRAYERKYTLDKIIEAHPDIVKKFPREFSEAYARGAYHEAQYQMSENNHFMAFKTLSKYIFLDYRYFMLAFLTLMPKVFWDYVQTKKYKRK